MTIEKKINELSIKIERLKQNFNEFIEDLYNGDVSVLQVRVKDKKKDAIIYINPKKTKRLKFKDKDVVLVQKL
jgi:predicted methyltransferase